MTDQPSPHRWSAPDTSTRSHGRPADFHVAVDIVLFSLRDDLLHIGVVQRRSDTAFIDQHHLGRRRTPGLARDVVEVPRDHQHHWALPGGHVGNTLLGDRYGTGQTPDPSLEAAAVRVLGREAGIHVSPSDIHQVGAFGDAKRDPRSGQTISVAYMAVVGSDHDVARHPDDAVGHVRRVQFRPVVDVLARPNRLEFDHEDILMAAIRLLRDLVVTTPLATRFCRHEFTMGELRRVYEVIFHESLDSPDEAERPEHAGAVRQYLQRLELLGATPDPELERAVNELAVLLPAARSGESDLVFADGTVAKRRRHERRSAVHPDMLASHEPTSTTSFDLARQALLLSRLLRHSSGLKPPRAPRLLRSLDPTNFARKIHKIGILEPVHGESRPTFDRYGKPAALFRVNPHRENQPFLLRIDSLSKPDPTD